MKRPTPQQAFERWYAATYPSDPFGVASRFMQMQEAWLAAVKWFKSDRGEKHGS